MKFSRYLVALLLSSVALSPLAMADDVGYRQVRVNVELRREGVIKEEYVENERTGSYTLVLKARWETLLEFNPEDGTDHPFDASSTTRSSPVSGTVSFNGTAQLAKPEGTMPMKSSIQFSGKLSPKAIWLDEVSPGTPFFKTPTVSLQLEIPMSGSVKGYMPELGPASGLAIFNAPFQSEDGVTGTLEGVQKFFGEMGPRPDDKMARHAYDLTKAMTGMMQAIPSGATGVWSGVKYERTGKSWILTCEGTKTWPVAEGSVTDTIKLEIVPVAKTLEDPADESDDNE